MIKAPLISIIIPVYNAGNYIARTLTSVQQQTLSDWELIVVDDGSHDNSADMVRTYAANDSRICLIQQSNTGVAKARNRGYSASHSSSPYVIFLDHDDTWEPEALARLLSSIEGDTTACAAHARARYIDESDQPHSQQFIKQHHRIRDEIVQSRRAVVGTRVGNSPDEAHTTFATLAVNNCILSPGAVLLRRSALPASLPFDAAFAPCDDWHLWVRMARKADFLFVPDVLFNYRLHRSNVSHNHAAMETARHAAMCYIVTSPDNTPEQKQIANAALAFSQKFGVKLRLRWARESLARGEFLLAAKQLRHAVRYHQ